MSRSESGECHEVELSEFEMIWCIQSERERGAISFREAVYALVSLIPKGSVLSYGQVAHLLGSPRAARQVGFALSALHPKRTDPENIHHVPWWRVIRTSGQIALRGDSERPEIQRDLLRSEEITITDYIVDMKRYAWKISGTAQQ